MDRLSATERLSSDSVEERLAAARFFSLNATAEDLPLLRKALSRENVRWTVRALERAISVAITVLPKPQNESSPSEPEPDDQAVRAIHSKAVEEVTRTILHEFGPVVGSIKLTCTSEISNYSDSRTKKNVDRLSILMTAIGTLSKAVASPHYTRFDLHDLVEECISSPSFLDIEHFPKIIIEPAGPRPFLTEADRGALLLALTNGLKNAAEAVQESSKTSQPKIIINWGRAGTEDFLAVIDTGPGFPGNPQDALKIGVTNKSENHIGYGLATAQHAMRSMEGDVLVSNTIDGSARFELRWCKTHENTNN